ncbi:unnamed protein product [Penicillium salamii]|uniref:Uncharacterized protein n=1 Tax=Penicillium salamii TaxID=1612424 RepID=A0A9W4J7J8_9EURO|nr:unnamed protein product [Penicillium salamii]CAG8084934.1 unnamed protein product [Penicillium salamii]CAG8241198.1 unnamed protein product [Penicillium salamii]CAG8244417.1 unnamed protein product [Penicillium salamii]CAG8265837.1 unnamed protein product [Penicillium salamii]
MSAKGPFHLVTVNTAPERAKRLIGRVAEALKDQYTIVHVDNCESKHVVLEWDNNRLTIAEIDEVEAKVKQHNPEVLFSASMWSAEEAQQIHAIARSVRPDIKLHAIPEGLQVERGPDAIVEYLCEKVPVLLDS